MLNELMSALGFSAWIWVITSLMSGLSVAPVEYAAEPTIIPSDAEPSAFWTLAGSEAAVTATGVLGALLWCTLAMTFGSSVGGIGEMMHLAPAESSGARAG